MRGNVMAKLVVPSELSGANVATELRLRAALEFAVALQRVRRTVDFVTPRALSAPS